MLPTDEKAYAQRAFIGLKRQSYAGVLRERLFEIECAVHEGKRHESIRVGIQEQGYIASIGTFRKSLSRARIWWRRQLLLQIAQQAVQARGVTTHQGQADLGARPAPKKPTEQSGRDAISNAQGGNHAGSKTDPEASKTRAQRAELDHFFASKSVFKKS